jgi:hypothetical protein
LTNHPEIDAAEIEVNAKDGEVILTGTVDNRRTKRMAEDVAEIKFKCDNTRIAGARQGRSESGAERGRTGKAGQKR